MKGDETVNVLVVGSNGMGPTLSSLLEMGSLLTSKQPSSAVERQTLRHAMLQVFLDHVGNVRALERICHPRPSPRRQ